MTIKNFLRYYNRLTGADRTLVFFIYQNLVYLYNCKHISPKWCYWTRESQKNGGIEKVKMRLTLKEKQRILSKSIPVMTVEQFESLPYPTNKGRRCEFWLHQVCGLGEYKPDSMRFDKCGDIRINGVEYQVKFQNASLTNVDILHKAQKDARKKGKGT